MKIIHYVKKWTVGGIENVVYNLLINDNENDKTLCIGEIVDQYKLQELKEQGVNIYDLNDRKKKNKVDSYKTDYDRLAQILKDNQFDIAHIHINNAFGMIYGELFKEYGCKVVMHSHNTGFGSHKIIKSMFRYPLQKKCKKYCDCFIGCSTKAIKFAFGKTDNQHTYVLHNCINVEDFKYSQQKRDALRLKYNIKEEQIVLGHIGHFNAQKNQMFLVTLMRELSMENPEKYKLIMVGDGETKEDIRTEIKKESLESSIILLNSDEQISQYYSAFDIFVFPSLFEGFGIAAIEAQVSGLRTIISKNVPSEVMLTDRIIKADINAVNEWKVLIQKDANVYERIDQGEKIKKAGYDISSLYKQLNSIYKQLLMSGEVG